MSTHTVNINGIDLVYDKEGSGPPLVFLHGGNASAVWCEHVLPHFMGEYTCYALEQRGHGRSGRSPNADYSFASFIDEGVQFLEAVSGPAALVGWSQGGLVAMGTAAKRPDLVPAIYLEDSLPAIYGAGRLGQTAVPAFFGVLASVAEQKERESASVIQHAYNIGQIPAGGSQLLSLWPPEMLLHFARHSHGTDPEYYRQIADGSSALPDGVCAEIPARVTCAVHLAHGDPETGSVIVPGDIEAVRSVGLSLTTTHFPGAGHNIALPFARAFIEDLKAFLDRVA